ncbi:MAG: hypothetical protein ACKOXB_04995 [Flavobacteriales bacterium]
MYWKIFNVFVLLTLSNYASAQLGKVELPTYNTMQPVYTDGGVKDHQNQTQRSSLNEEKIRVQEQNVLVHQKAVISADDKRKAYNEFLREYREDELRKQFDLMRQKPSDSIKIREYNNLKKKLRIVDVSSASYISNSKFYVGAAEELQKMLDGKIPMNLKRAVFISENAWYGNTKSYSSFCKQIDQLVWICREVLKQEKLIEQDPVACHYAIQKLFSDTIVVKKADGSLKAIPPLHYDFEDFFGEKDYSKFFVLKLLDSKSGQCHSLPLLYLILASEMKVPAYLSIAPNHSFIKYPAGKKMCNFECTSGAIVSDGWMVGSGYISSMAIRNGIYLAPQTLKETIAQCLNDLISGYQQKFGYDDYVLLNSQKVLQHYPMCISAMLTISNCVTAYCFRMAEKHRFPSKKEMEQIPELKQRYDLMIDLERDIEALGYIKIPLEEYEKWLLSAREK